MQIPHGSVAEIMGHAGYDWIAVDLEHGAIGVHQLPDIFRALELGGTLPLARLAQGTPKDCKQALDAGAGGVIVPMIESATQLEIVRDACCWPPSGTRGVGFSRANLFGKKFSTYVDEAQAPLLVAMIEHVRAVEQLPDILAVEGLDAVLIGPYDLSASMGITADFDNPKMELALCRINQLAAAANIACGIHIVEPSQEQLYQRISSGYRFLAYSIDGVFLNTVAQNPYRKIYAK
jgi:2-dehydro-3-deoxyglucarate aldolase